MSGRSKKLSGGSFPQPKTPTEKFLKLVDTITHTGEPHLDQKMIREIKKSCKHDDSNVPLLKERLMRHLTKNHSEVRLSAFQVVKEIFKRSHKFRHLIVDDLQEVLALTLETEPGRMLLPLPEDARKRLKTLALETMKEWVEEFGDSYIKLHHAFNFLKQVKKISFNAGESQTTEAQRRQEAEKRLKTERIWKHRTSKVREEIEERTDEIKDCVTQIQNCLELLISTPSNFLHGQKDENEDEADDEDDERTHGILDRRAVIKIDLGESDQIDPEENKPVVESLKDQYVLLTSRLLPLVKKWVVVLTKAGNDDSRELLRTAIDLKGDLEKAETKAKSLGDEFVAKKSKRGSDDEDEDDFEDVPEKVDYQESAEKDGLLEMVFLKSEMETSCRPSTSKVETGKSEAEEGGVPVVPFDVDLMNWGEEDETTTKVLVNRDSHRFWGSNLARDDEEMEVPKNSQRVIEFAGKFEPVKWSCRAPFPSGKLCPRMDRNKCPLHGPIVARDAVTGRPSGSEHEPEKSDGGNDEWNDPELLRDIEEATGQQLSSKKGKGKGKKSNGRLTNIQESQNTVRKRLEKKVFNKSSLKRVAASLDVVDSKRTKDRFTDQFNYLMN